jgi:hypothetical protein
MGTSGGWRVRLELCGECHTLAELEDAINSLPATLEETYERALLVIDN